MTFDDDFVSLELPTGGPVNLPCHRLGIEWPPPERLILSGAVQMEAVRVSMSEITDEDRASMTHVCRGARYRFVDRGMS